MLSSFSSSYPGVACLRKPHRVVQHQPCNTLSSTQRPQPAHTLPQSPPPGLHHPHTHTPAVQGQPQRLLLFPATCMSLSLSSLRLFMQPPPHYTIEQALEMPASLRGESWGMRVVSARRMGMTALMASLQLTDKPASSKQLLLLNSKLMREPDKVS